MTIYMKRSFLYTCTFLVLSLVWISCDDKVLERVTVYSAEFSTSGESQISNAKWHEFHGDTVLGWYHNEEISLTLDNLPDHNTVEITVELLIHDSWDGNQNGAGGPDHWYMLLDEQEIINTTFSNTPCGSNYCLYQSFPENYPRNLNPKTGAIDTGLPGRCQYKDVPGWTTKYRITRLIKHRNPTITLRLGDQLTQSNATDPGCDESWSVTKLEVSALS